MPAYTAAQLSAILGSGEYNYVAPGGDFNTALAQVLPRLMAMGLWRDTTYEISLPNKYGYVSLPEDTDAVLAATVNNRARPVRSMWHDIRITGRHATLSPYYGVVDAGWYPVLLAPEDTIVNDVTSATIDKDSGIGLETINTLNETGGSIDSTTFAGKIEIIGEGDNGSVTWTQPTSGPFSFTSGEPVYSITSIVYSDVPFTVLLLDNDNYDRTTPLAIVPPGSGVLRFRRFRTSQPSEDSTVHLLVKRAAPTNITDDTIIYLGNIGAIKHGLLGLIAEDNADIERSQFHWGMCGKLLDEELLSILGAAKPTLNVDLSGCGSALPIYNQY